MGAAASFTAPSAIADAQRAAVLPAGTLDLAAVAAKIDAGAVQRIVVCCGAGISTSAGIPDFRTPGTGLYANLQTYDLERAEDIFTLSYFRERPEAFCTLAAALFPGDRFAPTATHHFLRLLQEKRLLRRVFTQNIDGLEHRAGVPAHRVVQCHGGFDSAACAGEECGALCERAWLKAELDAERVPRCACCGAPCKPSIVFFGESLPSRFAEMRARDLAECDLLIVLGTSLAVAPVSTLPDGVHPLCPRLVINRERTERALPPGHDGDAPGFRFGRADNYRDVFVKRDVDDGVRELCDLLGWRAELDALESNFDAEEARAWATSAAPGGALAGEAARSAAVAARFSAAQSARAAAADAAAAATSAEQRMAESTAPCGSALARAAAATPVQLHGPERLERMTSVEVATAHAVSRRVARAAIDDSYDGTPSELDVNWAKFQDMPRQMAEKIAASF